ncbi:phosphonopyruvate decarboxylase [Streptomyces viridochromogenes DSM 40736]|uniref:Phosphonopyruvate decarboxylase n=1 Tax=Streptomyces viridochromogenes (strain DSM 40736 / JCM 4977 / BCRC 1201 / Tue 494) TaxID=591159 RepID=PPD_STRVT|nr:phosphonopyruvate decarboxylase [Streptomyces viridochromogenes]O86938.1 RecName: Full=Phosphonopyruvate decarboxylase [Streptomyces viridochromogenes DSM 40736]AAU00072.1 phosphonopyruvate decarboxylase [Streptomyces viridochromogenes]EFL30520.1 phosphonopyruvate decarboxylase [Streptomyces viridochromogenes DSM 40736]CAJ14045.1 phosphonopyruvate decarboxylase Ppd [Streptomyces viridochromogenes]
MIGAADLVAGLTGLGVTTVAGVPCSYLTPLINRVISDPATRYLTVTQEGEAAAVAAGAWLGGGLGCAITQNSGLGNMTNPLTSLLHPARIPAVVITTWRGRPGEKDEPQHHLMGRITGDLLDLCDMEWSLIPDTTDELHTAFAACRASLAHRELPYGFLLPQGVVADEPLNETAPRSATGQVVRYARPGRSAARPTRIAALERLLAELPRDAAVVSTTGKSSRELYTLDDRDQHFYMVGAMGSAATVGLGVALHTPRPVVVVDGDGSVLMRLGSLATVGAHAPGNLVHLVLDNGVHDSTGGQRTLSSAVDLPAVAAACGYRAVHACTSLDDLSDALATALATDGPTLVHLAIRPGSLDGLGRPKVTPAEVARRFRAFVTTPPAGTATPVHAGGVTAR